MGLPELNFTLTRAAETVAARTARGNVALILRDAAANGTHTIHREADIPSALGANNIAYIKQALVGYINRPSCVYAAVIPAAGALADGFAALQLYAYDFLAGPPDITDEEATALAALVKAQRTKRYIGKAVLPDTAADYEGVVNFAATGILAGGKTYDNAQYAARVAGILAGTPADCSATYAALPEVTGVNAVADPDKAVDEGKLILVDDGRQVKLGRAVTSKVTLQPTEPKSLKKIKMVAALDLIRYYAVTTIEDQYLGRCANSYDNKCILLTALRDYLITLEGAGVLEKGSSGAELDDKVIRAWLIEQATQAGDSAEVQRIQSLDDAVIRKEDTGSRVFLRLQGHVLDAMEDFDIGLVAE